MIAALGALTIGLFALVPLAQAEELSHAEIEKLPQIAEWTYDNGAVTNPMGCGTLCSHLWRAEHGLMPSLRAADEIWNSLGALEELEHYWPPLEDFRGGFGDQTLASRALVAWEMGTEQRRWLSLYYGAPLPETEHRACPVGADFVEMLPPGSEISEPHGSSSTSSWEYLAQNQFCPDDTITQYTEATQGACQEGETELPGGFETSFLVVNECIQENEGHKEAFPIIGVRATRPFGWARPEGAGPPEGVTTLVRSPETQIQDSHSPAQLADELRGFLEDPGNATLNQWLRYHLTGEGKDPTQAGFSPGELLGPENTSERDRPPCNKGPHPVNCATGNQFETQTDLRVGGRGPGLTLTRTYNSQLAAQQSEPGPLGYGWTSTYSAYITTDPSAKLVTVHQDNGSTVSFEENVEGKYVGTNPLVESALAKEGTGYAFTLPDQARLQFNGEGQLTQETDRYGSAVPLTYEGGHLSKATDSAGRSLTFTYQEGLVHSVTDPMGHTVEYSYGSGSEAGELKSVKEPGESNPRWRFGYNSLHELTSETDGRDNTVITEYDSLGRVTAQTDPMDRKRTWSYNTNPEGEPETTITEPNGSVTLEKFNTIGEPTTVTQASGTALEATTTYFYDSDYHLHLAIDPNSHRTEYEYSPEGNLMRTKDAEGNETKWTYDSTHDVHTVTDPNDETTTIEREPDGNAKEVKRPAPGGHEQLTKYTYYTAGPEKNLVKTMTDPRDNTWHYAYDEYGDLISETDPEEDTRTWSYNKDSEETSTTSPRGNVTEGEPVRLTTTIQRDEQGRPTLVTEPPIGYHEETHFSSSSHIEVPSGLAVDTVNHHIFVSDSWNHRVEEFSEEAGHWRWTKEISEASKFDYPNQLALDAQGNLWVADGGNGHPGTGRVVEINPSKPPEEQVEAELTGKEQGPGGEDELRCPSGVAMDPEGHIWVLDECKDRVEEFEPSGTVIQKFGSEGHGHSEFEFPEGLAIATSGSTCDVWVSDFANSRLQEFKCSNHEWVREVGSRGGGPEKLYNPDGVAIGAEGNVFVSDWFNMRLDVYSPEGKFIETIGYTSPGEGQIELPGQSVGVPEGQIWVTDRSTGRVERWGPYSSTTAYTYDEDGNVKSVKDPDGNTAKYEYDDDNELTKVIEPNEATEETKYDSAGQVEAQIDGSHHETKYKRNALEEVEEVIDPRGRATKMTYDRAGDLKTQTSPESKTTCYEYDADNRLETIGYFTNSECKTGTGEPSVEYKYDADGNRAKMLDASGTTEYTFDELDRLIKSEHKHGDTTETVAYKYGLDNEPTTITYPNGEEVERSYDKDDRLSAVTDWLGHETKFEYNPDSDLIKTMLPSGTGEEDHYAYDGADQMSEVTIDEGSATLASLAYTRDPEGNVTKTMTSSGLPEAGTTEYTYDPDGRLVAGVSTGGVTGYKYDEANNLKEIGSTAQHFDEADELRESGTTKYLYNQDGERTEASPEIGPATTYAYNQAEELTSVKREADGSAPKLEDAYSYNGEGLRASQTVSGTTNYMTWDEAESLPLLLSDGANSYVYGAGGLPVEQVNNSTGAVTYLHHDQQGSTRLLTSGSGEVVGKCSYAAYGSSNCAGSVTTPLLYDSQYTNADTGLIYLRARSYDPSTGQFLSRDPWDAATHEPYAYVWDNPLNSEDRSGAFGGAELAGTAGASDTTCAGTWEVPFLDVVTCGAAVVTTSAAAAYGAYEGGKAIVHSVESNGAAEESTPGGEAQECAPTGVTGSSEAGQPGVSVSDHVAGQAERRGWTDEAINDTIQNPAATHDVWDYNPGGGSREPATAYEDADGDYVVVNDVDDQVIQVSDKNDPGWKPVWDDPRFQR